MTDEQRVFIRGVEGRGSEVIATLVNLGAKNNLRLDGNYPYRIYFITHDGGICYVGADSEYAEFLSCSLSTVWRRLKNKELEGTYMKMGNRYWFDPKKVLKKVSEV